jgi:hypothetical protein
MIAGDIGDGEQVDEFLQDGVLVLLPPFSGGEAGVIGLCRPDHGYGQ